MYRKVPRVRIPLSPLSDRGASLAALALAPRAPALFAWLSHAPLAIRFGRVARAAATFAWLSHAPLAFRFRKRRFGPPRRRCLRVAKSHFARHSGHHSRRLWVGARDDRVEPSAMWRERSGWRGWKGPDEEIFWRRASATCQCCRLPSTLPRACPGPRQTIFQREGASSDRTRGATAASPNFKDPHPHNDRSIAQLQRPHTRRPQDRRALQLPDFRPLGALPTGIVARVVPKHARPGRRNAGEPRQAWKGATVTGLPGARDIKLSSVRARSRESGTKPWRTSSIWFRT